MNPEKTYIPIKNRIHPLAAGAAVAVIVACGVATAAVMGWIPGSSASKSDQQALSATGNTAAPGQPGAAGAGGPAASAKQAPVRMAAAPTTSQQKAKCMDCGTVIDVKEIEVKGQASGGGALAGGAAGALLGHGLTSGNSGSGVVTVVGGVAGAVVGNEVEKRMKTHKRYDVAVRMDDGSTRTVSYEQAPTWRSGDHVRVAEGKIQPR